MLVLGKLALLCKLIKKESSTKLNIILYFAFKKRYVIHRIKRILQQRVHIRRRQMVWHWAIKRESMSSKRKPGDQNGSFGMKTCKSIFCASLLSAEQVL